METIKLAVRLPANREPFHPGVRLLEDFLQPPGMTQTELARRIGVSYVRVNELVNGKRGITPDTALRLSKLFNTSVEFWLNGQLRWDMWHALHSPAMAEIETIEPLRQDQDGKVSDPLPVMESITLAARLPANRRPTHPGEMLLEEFLKPMGITQTELAKRIGVSYVRVNELVNGKRGLTPDTALRLSRLFGNSVEFWLNGQLECDMWHALHSPALAEMEKIEPLPRREIEGEDNEPEALAAD